MEQSRQHERKSTEPSGARERIALTIAAPLVSSRRPSAAAPGAIAWATFRRLCFASAVTEIWPLLQQKKEVYLSRRVGVSPPAHYTLQTLKLGRHTALFLRIARVRRAHTPPHDRALAPHLRPTRHAPAPWGPRGGTIQHISRTRQGCGPETARPSPITQPFPRALPPTEGEPTLTVDSCSLREIGRYSMPAVPQPPLLDTPLSVRSAKPAETARWVTPGRISARSLKSIATAIQPVSFALKAGGKQRNTTPSPFLTGVRRDLPL